MGLFLNLLILLLGTIGSIAAIGGDTWLRDENISWSKRITHRGWLALACLIATFVVGGIKEVRNWELKSESTIKRENLENNVYALRKQNKNLDDKNEVLLEQSKILLDQNRALHDKLDIAENRITSAISESKTNDTDTAKKLLKDLSDIKAEISNARIKNTNLIFKAKKAINKVESDSSNIQNKKSNIIIEPRWIGDTKQKNK